MGVMKSSHLRDINRARGLDEAGRIAASYFRLKLNGSRHEDFAVRSQYLADKYQALIADVQPHLRPAVTEAQAQAIEDMALQHAWRASSPSSEGASEPTQAERPLQRSYADVVVTGPAPDRWEGPAEAPPPRPPTPAQAAMPRPPSPARAASRSPAASFVEATGYRDAVLRRRG